MKRRLVVGISGASGALYGIKMLEVLKDTDIEIHLVVSHAAKGIIRLETDWTVDHVESLADYVYEIDNVGAAIASGSFETMGMIVLPCSIKTLSGIANSFNTNLLIRAADVTLKERRKLVLMVRESPLHRGHLQLMMEATDIGAIISPPIPSFYNKPKSIDDIVVQTVGRGLQFFGINLDLVKRWSWEDGRRGMDLV